jgi:hypothetical protein
MDEYRRIFRDEWWVFAAVAAGAVLYGLWNGLNFFEATNAVVLTAFWSGVILGSLVLLTRIFSRKR